MLSLPPVAIVSCVGEVGVTSVPVGGAICSVFTPKSCASSLARERLEKTSKKMRSPLDPAEASSQPLGANPQQVTLYGVRVCGPMPNVPERYPQLTCCHAL